MQLVEQSKDEPRTGCPQWMTESNGASVYIRARTVEAQFLFDCQVLSGESFVDLNQIDVREFVAPEAA